MSISRQVLFVVTSDENMGDLALCQEWMADLGREQFGFGFVVSRRMQPFIDPRDRCHVFDPAVHVGDAILAAIGQQHADAVVFASNSFWNLPGQKGAEFGVFPREVLRAGVPVLAFDPFEIEFETSVPQVGGKVRFPAVPDEVWALRYMSRVSDRPNARHFCTRAIFDGARRRSREQVLARWGADPAKRSVFFAVSANRCAFIERYYPDYFRHLARLFSVPEAEGVQFLVVSPRRLPALSRCPRVVPLPLVPFDEFLALVAASDLYLADSLVSCLVNAFHLGVPAMLLANSERSRSRAPGSFLAGRFFPYKIFPYGFAEIGATLEQRFEIQGCYEEVEVLDRADFAAALRRVLFDAGANRALVDRCRAWKEARLRLPGPGETLESILSASAVPAALGGVA